MGGDDLSLERIPQQTKNKFNDKKQSVKSNYLTTKNKINNKFDKTF